MKRAFWVRAILCFVVGLVARAAHAETAFGGNAAIDIGNTFAAGGGFATHSINSATDATESIMIAPKALSFDQVCIRVGTNAGDPPAYKVGVQTVATSGNPIRSSGTYKSGSGECSASYDPPSGASHNDTRQCFTLTGTTCAVTKGEMFAITVVPTGVPDGSNYLQHAYANSAAYNDTSFSLNNIDGVTTVDAGTGTESQLVPASTLRNSSSDVYIGYPVKALQQTYFDDASNPDEFCNRIYFDLPTGCTYTLDGAFIRFGETFAAGSTWEARLYDGTPTQLDSFAADGDQITSTDAARQVRVYFDDGDSLSDATEYFVCVKHTGTGNGFILETEVEANAEFTAWPTANKEIYKATRNNGAGSFTTTTTRRMAIYPILGSVSCSGGGSGGESSSRINARVN